MPTQLSLPGFARLTKDIAPLDTIGPVAASVLGLLPKDDQVLMQLAMSDEREYDKMMTTDTAISGAVDQRKSGLLSYGWEVIEGEANNAQSALYKAFAEAQIRTLPKVDTLRSEVLSAIFLGWRPVELQWSSSFMFQRRPYYGVVRAVARDPWHYAFDPQEHLVRTLGMPMQEVFDQPLDAYRWMICTAGTTGSPYGRAWLRGLWLLYFLSKQFEKLSAQAMQRVLGVLKLVRSGGGSAAVGGAAIDQLAIDTEIKRVLKRLNSSNVLVEQAGFSFEMLTNPGATRDVTSMLEYFDSQKRIAIAGQNLTSKVQEGSFAAATVHANVLTDWQKADAAQEADWWNEGLVHKVIRLNFGEVPVEEMPRLQSRILSDPDMAAVKSYYDMGGTLDGRALAKAKNVPALFEITPEDVPLRKPDPMQLAALRASAAYVQAGGSLDAVDAEGEKPLPGQPKPPKPKAPNPAAATPAAPPAVAKQTTRTVAEELDAIEGELRAYYGEAAETFLRQHST